MIKCKSSKSSMVNGVQSSISAFFVSKVSPKSPKKIAAGITRVPVSLKTGFVQDKSVPCSPTPSAVPETPDNLRSENPSDTSYDNRSPVSRGLLTKGVRGKPSLMARKLMQPQKNSSLEPEDTFELKNGARHSGSVKRLLHSSENIQSAKRCRTMQVQKLPDCDTSSPRADQKESSGTLQRAFSKSPEKKNKAESVGFESSRLATGPCVKMNGKTNGFSKVSKKSFHHLSFSTSEKENSLALNMKPEIDMSTVSGTNDFDLVMSYSLWIQNGSTEEKETFLNCPFTKKRPLSTADLQVKDKIADGKTLPAPFEDDFTDLIDDWFDDGMEQKSEVPKPKKFSHEKNKGIPEHVILASGVHNRYWVLDVQDVTSSQSCTEKHLTITCSKTTQSREACILKDGWESTPVAVGDVVHLEGRCVSGLWTIDRDSGFLVLLPDLLISGTSIASSIRCMRRGVLGEMFKAFDGGSKQMLNGTIVHDIFQKAAMSSDFSPERIQTFAAEALRSPNYLGQMYSLKLTQADMRQEVEEYLPSLSEWAKHYVHTSPQAGQKQLTLKLPSDGALSKQDATCSMTVTDFVDIEENIWCPRFGLKGKIDVTAGVRIHRRGRRPTERIVPLELKTGKESNSIEHRSQVILYTLMSSARRCDPEAGFLVYLKTGSLHPVVGNHMDRRELVKIRNSLAHHIGNSLVKVDGRSQMAPLPAIESDKQACKYCPQKRNCAVYNRAVERDPVENCSENPQAFVQSESEHLSHVHLQYFSDWLLLCTLEALTMENKGGRRNIWLQTAQQREKSGGCVGNMQLDRDVSVLSDGVYKHSFVRKEGNQTLTGLIVGDRIVVSDQDSVLIGLATGYVTEITISGLTCSLDKNLSKFSSNTVFRLDQDEGAGGLSNHLGNLSMLMENTPTRSDHPFFFFLFFVLLYLQFFSIALAHFSKDTVANILKGLNKPQKQAMKKVLLSKDYTLIVGMPGTGKTTTICTLVRILHACGFSVLLTSYTHSAVDNILLKLNRFKIGFLRLGRAQKVHHDILPFTEESCRAKGIQTLEELEQLYNKELIVATTCMGVKHPIFSRRRFDFCIVDEASQISQPVCLGPLFYAQRFVLVGDHQQLPPIVQNAEARTLGMDESLFKRLEHHSDAVVQLNVQYRMNSAIMSLSNALMYEGQLECGSERTANAVLQLPSRAQVEKELDLYVCQPQYSAWVQAALEPNSPVCFLDTSEVPAPETVEKSGISNHTEAILVQALVTLLLKAGCRASDIGVIAPYRQQLKAISSLLQGDAFKALEVNTVDKYQGRDKSIIIVSFVRSNPEDNLGELLQDWRRLNVAITRAKHKLLMLGSAPTLRRYAPLEKLLCHLQQEDMIFQLPAAAHEALPGVHL
ncbi:LOW QUALITY PROTEIN: DNA replication ATP-dependent helicase/nuclease DNA2-like [Sinocyclocheilus anshuiensis]|uniref:LOW QUALITY PROTEIN: DNA replication ATP-dependent helicase/nuclease DNA2-like n=1 Tax=Sinocyclocheilus anshuiensis TaxID=1608454 RepID=UPI0007BA72EC|nr:PREDICTED: LOW QUALITY PROTEIN: DNA replication ATP-dependent helicase/nuclease DNA2-like [Sinocyclocheilus anshuiensis]